MSRMDVPLREHPDLMEMRDRYERANARASAQGTAGITLLACLYLAVSPWIVGFNGLTSITVNNLVTGLAAFAVTYGLGSAYGRTHGLAWVVPLVGVWTVIAPWVIRGVSAHPTDIVVNNSITGGFLILFGLAASLIGMRNRMGNAQR